MIESLITLSLTLATISAGLMAGVYFAFSGFIMRAFDQLGSKQAIESMNSINKTILRSWFMVLFFGSTLLFAILSTIALLDANLPGRWLLFTTGLIYVFGMFLCTAIFNVPLNNRLENVSNDDNVNSEGWAYYYKQWTRWNHFRGICSLASLALGMLYLVKFA